MQANDKWCALTLWQPSRPRVTTKCQNNMEIEEDCLIDIVETKKMIS